MSVQESNHKYQKHLEQLKNDEKSEISITEIFNKTRR